MKRTFTWFAFAILTASSALGQDPAQPMKPSPEVQKFARFIGNFKGGGTLVMAPGGKSETWTATARTESILGGFFVQMDEAIQATGMQFDLRTIYGWDAEEGEPISYAVTNMGPSPSQIRWLDDKTLVSTWHGTMDGKPYADRWVMTLDDKGYAFSMDRALGADPFFNHVKGRFDRVDKLEPQATPAAAAEPSAEMKPLAAMIGDWRVTGKIDIPLMKMDIAGDESIEWMYGGTVLAGRVKGDPDPMGLSYESQWYVTWDKEAGCYQQIFASNMGEVGMIEANLIDGNYVTTAARRMYGQPTVDRSVVELAGGGIKRVYADSIYGTGPATHSFEASYQRAGEKKTIEAKFSVGSCCAKAAAAGSTCTHPCCVEAAKAGKICEACNK